MAGLPAVAGQLAKGAERVSNMTDYVRQYGSDLLTDRPFCAVDALVLSQAAYVRWDGRVPPPGAEEEPVSLRTAVDAPQPEFLYKAAPEPEKTWVLLDAMAAAPRYRN